MKHSFFKLLYVLVVVSLLLSSCERQESTTVYYNIDSLLQDQIQFLTTKQAGLRKQAEINQVNQDTIFVPADSAAWANELDIFSEIGMINKPINRGNYDVIDGQADSTSNLTVRTYSANKSLSIIYLKTFYQDTPKKLRKIEAFYQQKNSLLASSRKFVLEFTDIYDKNILTSWSIDGHQKMFIGDSVRFTISCSIHLN